MEGLRLHGYTSVPPIEDTIANYLSMGEISMLKNPTLPLKPLGICHCGQASGALHMMAVLQAYQGLSPEAPLVAPVSPSELFGTSVKAVLDKFREVRAWSASYKKLILCTPRSVPKISGDPANFRHRGRVLLLWLLFPLLTGYKRGEK